MTRLSLVAAVIAVILFGGCVRQNTGVQQPQPEQKLVSVALQMADWAISQAQIDLASHGKVRPETVQQALLNSASSVKQLPASPATDHALKALGLIHEACKYTATPNFDQPTFYKKIGYARQHMAAARDALRIAKSYPVPRHH